MINQEKSSANLERKSRARLVLIDGHAILHRAYHALPPLTTSKGELVNAVFGFCSMLLKIRDELNPSCFAICFDLPKPTFRKKLYKNYQIKRPKMVDELAGQIERIKQVVKILGIPIYEKEGFEADDVIGTLTRQATKIQKTQNTQTTRRSDSQNIRRSDKSEFLIPRSSEFSEYSNNTEVIIVTGDRDLLQLVDKNTKVYMLIRGLTEATLFDETKVEEKYGLKPDQIADYKALIGDSSDNYPGVSGIGPKTARDLLQRYVTLKQLYKDIDNLELGLRQKLQKGRKVAELSQKLATIVSDVPVKLDLKKCAVGDFTKPEVINLFEELEFKSLIGRLSGKQKEKPAIQKARKGKKENTEDLEQMGLF